MELKPLKVSELNQYIKRLIISDPILYNIGVEGEISNFTHHYNGHMYLTIKDEKSKLKCIMFSEDNSELDWVPKNGDNISANGYISVYDREGVYQLYIKKLRKKGIGELYEELQKLKAKLRSQGLFDEENKKELPFMPKKIGVITSSTGAVVRDIVSTIKRRMKSTNIDIYQVTVQGDKAKKDICRAISYFNKQNDVDIIILARGGGSVEELWTFNEEEVAREIYKSKIPIVSAIGHETDFTVSDFVSDKRASTPSVAAEMTVPSYNDLEFKMISLYQDLVSSYKNIIDMKKMQSQDLKSRLDENSPKYKLELQKNRLQLLWEDLSFEISNKIKDSKNKTENLANKLDALSPLSTLNRGFTMVSNKDGEILNSIDQVKIDQKLDMTLKDGQLEVQILDIKDRVKEDE